ncbi:MAG: sigma-54-dependent Fis family transcriptional regulator [Rhodospirillaceae bacterium]|jgi:two-component system, response regulator FlrC|nr:sigma-54-dependent Fis family transcriptional regulator [Rhodospirillaceae bacterium]MBT4218816.1 sigma-54-dependent Fis family transcriptional regulator [Rhodospirillaceae bacterium]MBT5013415.1 sigma-54-dependent Fis family transcriptional regulator [Rhodospirillaceae bacterium]MBT5309573.1 sigma-54-dependent Fis family transcriptional regulator [Rhodospirillaceae bacterium]MBT7356117.1 sigma-54-dependent Fis family transcriptional regulator [Rhodospirillaceae bacterium]
MRLLIIGTLDGQIGGASRIAVERGAKVTQVDDIQGGLETLRAGNGADLLMVDVNLDIGLLISSLEAERITIPVVACGIGNDTRAAVKAIKAGAKEYIPLPPDTDLIAAVLSAVTEETHAIEFKDPAMAEVLKMATQVAPSDASIMVTGQSGTGKELMARFLHAKSLRSKGPFIAVNCAAIPENLLESELFGYEKGSFTGAVARRIGKFEEANGGTLLLDEISEMDPHLQAKLLRAVQEREIDRIGGTRPVKVDVRIVATSNRNMADEIAENRFREDLYFRLNVVNLALPSLSERPLDILHLSSHFIAKYAKENCVDALPLSDSATQALQDYPWPGNVRELENAMHRAVLLSSGKEISTDAIQLTAAASSSDKAAPTAIGGDMVGQTVAQVERGLIIDTLQHCLGNRTHAANILGISIRTLRNKLKLYNEQGFAVPMPGETERPSV